MTLLLRTLQLALAALLASAGGGLILALLLTVAAIAAGAVSEGSGAGTIPAAAPLMLAIALFGGGMAIGPAVGAAWLPAFAAGAALWAAGRRRDWPRRRIAWALAGAAVALLCWFRIFEPGAPGPRPLGLFRLPEPAVAALFLLAGAAAGQLFSSALAATGPFFGFDDREAG